MQPANTHILFYPADESSSPVLQKHEDHTSILTLSNFNLPPMAGRYWPPLTISHGTRSLRISRCHRSYCCQSFNVTCAEHVFDSKYAGLACVVEASSRVSLSVEASGYGGAVNSDNATLAPLIAIAVPRRVQIAGLCVMADPTTERSFWGIYLRSAENKSPKPIAHVRGSRLPLVG